MVVPGRGNPNAAGLVLGEAPGADEEAQGKPFVGKSGQLLSQCLEGAGLREEELWITNVIQIRPEGNRTPYNSEVREALPSLIQELDRIRPEIILGLGNVPLLAMLDKEGGITRQRGALHQIQWAESQCLFLPTFHPSYVLRNGGPESDAGKLFVADIHRFAKEVLRYSHTSMRKEVSLPNFFDEFKEVSGNFVGAEEKEVLMQEGIPFQVVEILDDDGNKYGPRFIANVLLPNPENGEEEQRSIGFPKETVDSRDRMLTQMQEYLSRDDAQPVVVKLEKIGRSIIVRNAAAE